MTLSSIITADGINGLFEVFGALAVCQSIRRVLKDRRVAGVSWIHISFFTSWGVWNMFYYPSLKQWMSFGGGLAVATANLAYLGLILYYEANAAPPAPPSPPQGSDTGEARKRLPRVHGSGGFAI